MRLATARASRVSTTATSRSNNYYNIEMIEGVTTISHPFSYIRRLNKDFLVKLRTLATLTPRLNAAYALDTEDGEAAILCRLGKTKEDNP